MREVPGELGAAPQAALSSPGRGAGRSSSGVRVSGGRSPRALPGDAPQPWLDLWVHADRALSFQPAGRWHRVHPGYRPQAGQMDLGQGIHPENSGKCQCCWRASDPHAFSGRGTWPFLPSGALGPGWGCIGCQLGLGRASTHLPGLLERLGHVCVCTCTCACVSKCVCVRVCACTCVQLLCATSLTWVSSQGPCYNLKTVSPAGLCLTLSV